MRKLNGKVKVLLYYVKVLWNHLKIATFYAFSCYFHSIPNTKYWCCHQSISALHSNRNCRRLTWFRFRLSAVHLYFSGFSLAFTLCSFSFSPISIFTVNLFPNSDHKCPISGMYRIRSSDIYSWQIIQFES